MLEYLIVLFILLILNGLPQAEPMKKSFILPISFFILWVFLAFRYYYGLDYDSYLSNFSSVKSEEVQASEFLFWKFFYSFKYYYQFIIVHTTIVLGTLFYLTRRYVSPHYYSIVFFVFMCHPGMMFNYISAMRSALASCAFIWAADFTYIRKKRLLLFVLLILIISFIHKSTLMLLSVPLVDIFWRKIKSGVWNFLLIGAIFFSFILVTFAAHWIVDNGFVDYRYMEYLDQDKLYNSNIKNLFLRFFMIFPSIYMVKSYNNYKFSVDKIRIYTIALSFFILFFMGFDFENRLTVLIFIFALISIINCFDINTSLTKVVLVKLSMYCFILLNLYLAFRAMTRMIEMPGNYLFYNSLLTMPLSTWP